MVDPPELIRPGSIRPKCGRSAPDAGSFRPNGVGIRVHLLCIRYIALCYL